MSEETFDPLEGKEADEQQTPVIPIDGKAKQKDRDNRKKLSILTDQLVAHAKVKSLQCFCFIDGEGKGLAKIRGNYSQSMIEGVIVHLAYGFPDVFQATIESMNKAAEAQMKSQETVTEPENEDTAQPASGELETKDEGNEGVSG